MIIAISNLISLSLNLRQRIVVVSPTSLNVTQLTPFLLNEVNWVSQFILCFFYTCCHFLCVPDRWSGSATQKRDEETVRCQIYHFTTSNFSFGKKDLLNCCLPLAQLSKWVITFTSPVCHFTFGQLGSPCRWPLRWLYDNSQGADQSVQPLRFWHLRLHWEKWRMSDSVTHTIIAYSWQMVFPITRSNGKGCAEGCPVARERFRLIWKSTEPDLFHLQLIWPLLPHWLIVLDCW